LWVKLLTASRAYQVFPRNMEEQGKYPDIKEVARRIALEIEKETKRIL